MSLDQMEGSVFGTGLLANLLCFANLRSREYGISTSAERTAPLSVKRRKAFRFFSYRLRRCIHRDMASPRVMVRSVATPLRLSLYPKRAKTKSVYVPCSGILESDMSEQIKGSTAQLRIQGAVASLGKTSFTQS